MFPAGVIIGNPFAGLYVFTDKSLDIHTPLGSLSGFEYLAFASSVLGNLSDFKIVNIFCIHNYIIVTN